MSFIAELKRRNVIRVAIGYVAVSWLVLQAGSLIFGMFDLPNTLMRGLLALLAIGFIPALVFAWVYELTPEGLKLASKVSPGESVTHLTGRKLDYVVIGVLVTIVVLLLVDKFVVTPWRENASESRSANAVQSAGAELRKGDPASGAPALGATSTAVLPFVNMSSDKANEYFSDGMTETLLNRLAQVPQLKVAARTSSFSFKGTNTDMRKIGAALGVASIVEGSVQQAGDTLRITAQLIRAIDGAHLWSHNYDRKAADLFAIQDEIANAVTEALIGELLPKTKEILAKGGTKDLAAYDAYARGLEQISVNSFAGNQQAEALMKEALARDPNYVDAMVGLVFSWATMMRTGQIPLADFQARAEPMLARIEAVDPDNASAFAFRGEIADERGEHELAVQLGRRAVAAAPGDARIHILVGTIYGSQGDVAAEIAELSQAVALNPLDHNIIRFRGSALAGAGRLDEARADVLKAIELGPKDSSNFWALGLNDQARGDLVAAAVHGMKSYLLDPADPESSAVEARYMAEIGEFAAADAWIGASQRSAPGNLMAASMAVITAYYAGDAKKTFEGALALVARGADDHHGFWHVAMVTGCLAANELGRTPQIRAALVEARFLPADFGAAAFNEWKGPQRSAKMPLREIAFLRQCVYSAARADQSRRDQLRAQFAAAFGSDWETQPEWQSLAAELRNDRAAMLAEALPPRQSSVADLALRAGSARLYGIADDPRLTAHFAEQRKQVEQMRAALPAALAKENLTLMPPAR
jgi:TolB-like protein/Tfp pilus assembly protein PilF